MDIINAANATPAGVTAAFNLAVDGDTVLIPFTAGTTWTIPVTLTKAITIQGAGITSGGNLTRLVNGTGGDMLIVSLAAGSANLPVRITGISFDCAAWGTNYAIRFLAKATQLRIDHCKFNLGKHVLWFNTYNNGVVDHNAFINPSIAVFVTDIEAGDVLDGDHAWLRPLTPGNPDAIFVEDNTITLDNNAPGDNDEELYGQGGGRGVFRYNTLTSTYSGTTACIDAHGRYGSFRSTRMYEVYENTFHVHSTGRFCNLRGGKHFFFNNTFVNDTSSNQATVFSLIWELGVNQGNENVFGYFYNNTFNGSPITLINHPDNHPVLNTDYFIRPPMSGDTYFPYSPYVYPHPLVGGVSLSPTFLDFGSVAVNSTPADKTVTLQNNIGSPITVLPFGLSAPYSIIPDEPVNIPTGGVYNFSVRFRPTSNGAFNDSISVQGAAFDMPVTGIAFTPVPIISVSPSSLDFGMVVIGSTKSLNVTVSNTGAGTLSGSASTSAPFSILSGSPYSITTGSADVAIKYTPVSVTTTNSTAVFTGGAGTTVSLMATGVAVQASLTFAGDAGSIRAPYQTDGSNHVYQTTDTTLSGSGEVAYAFTIVDAGDYTVVINVKAEASDSNSMYVAIDAEPIDPNNIWDISPLTSGFQNRTVGWRGTGISIPEFPIKYFTLSAGVHTLIIRGREANTYIGQITITPAIVSPPADPPIYLSPLDGETELVITSDLEWSTAAGATSYDVYFGTTNPPSLIFTGSSATAYFPTLDYDTTYYWKIAARNAGGATPGPVFSFTTIPPKDTDPITSPVPANMATGVSLTPTLRWNGVGDTYDIAFDDATPPATASTSQVDNFYEATGLAYSTPYYWRVIAHRSGGDETGPIWSFTTMDEPTTATVPQIIYVRPA